jgi:hypothetical protein
MATIPFAPTSKKVMVVASIRKCLNISKSPVVKHVKARGVTGE